MTAAAATPFDPANLKPSQIKTIIHYCKATGGCTDGPEETGSSYDVTSLSAADIVKTFNYCKSINVPYCTWYTLNQNVFQNVLDDLDPDIIAKRKAAAEAKAAAAAKAAQEKQDAEDAKILAAAAKI